MASHGGEADRLVAVGKEGDLSLHIIEFDPRRSDQYLFAAAPDSDSAVAMAAKVLQPDPIPWPAGQAPVPTRPTRRPATTAPLPQADVLVVTYTVAEALALANVLTPGWATDDWVRYRNGWQQLKKTVEPGRAPSLERDQAGLWATTTIGDVSAVVVKSDLHPSTDGAQLPIRALWKQMIGQVQPKLVITTGTAGAVGADVLLGDVIVSRHVRWDAILRFANAPFAHQGYTSPAKLHAGQFSAALKTLIPVNAKRLPAAERAPLIFRDTHATPASVISTDFFAFDDVRDNWHLRGYEPHAKAVEMDDAALGLACQDLGEDTAWFSVRNASDPQMNAATLAQEKKQAAAIYEKYGYWTSIGSVITCWALITEVGTRTAQHPNGARRRDSVS